MADDKQKPAQSDPWQEAAKSYQAAGAQSSTPSTGDDDWKLWQQGSSGSESGASPATDWLSKLIGQKEKPAIETALEPSMHSADQGVFGNVMTGAGNFLKGAGHMVTHPEELVTGPLLSSPPAVFVHDAMDAYKHLKGEPNAGDEARQHPIESIEYGLGEAAPLALVGGAESLPSKGRANAVFADIENQARNTPVYMTETGPAVQRFRDFVGTGGRNSRVLTKLANRIENTPPRPSPKPLAINRPDRLLGAGMEDIPLERHPSVEPASSPMAFSAERMPSANITGFGSDAGDAGNLGRNFRELGSTAQTVPPRLTREAYLSGGEHPELSGRAPVIEGVLRRPRVFAPLPPETPPDYEPALNFPEARRFYSNVSEASRRPGFLRRAIESPSAPKMRYQLGGVREAMNSDLTNALPPELADRYTNALREYAQAARLGKVAKGAGAVALAEGLRRAGAAGKVFGAATQ